MKLEALEPEAVKYELGKVQLQAQLPDESAIELKSQFGVFYKLIEELRERAVTVTDPENEIHRKTARVVRIGLKDVRCDIERTRKSLKENSLRRGKAIDGFANILKFLCEPVEEKLLQVEQYWEIKEQKRISEMVELRTQALALLGADPSAYNLAAMDEKTWDIILDTSKKQKEERDAIAAKMEAERIERERAEAAERERMRLENERLKSEAMKRDEELRKEREAAEMAKREADAKQKAEADRIAKEHAAEVAKAKAIADAERAEREASQRVVERLEREKREAANRAEMDELKRKEAIVAAEEKASQAPDKEKLFRYIEPMKCFTSPIDMKTKAGQVAAETIWKMIVKLETESLVIIKKL